MSSPVSPIGESCGGNLRNRYTAVFLCHAKAHPVTMLLYYTDKTGCQGLNLL